MLIAQLSDPHVVAPGEGLLGGIDTATYLRAAVAHVAALSTPPDLVLITGDLVNDGHPEQYAHLAELIAPLGAAVHLLPGNHDDVPALRAAFPGQVHHREGRADGVLEGAVRWVDLMAIPKDAPHAANAHALIDYLLKPEVSAGITNYVAYASPNTAATALVDPEITGDPAIYPPAEVLAKLVDPVTFDPEVTRERVRAWTTIKTGR